MVLDMSHQTPFPNELRKWSTIWPHLQHLDYTNILQLRVQGAPGRLPCVTGLNLLWCGDCTVLGVCCFDGSNCKRRSINTCWEKSGGSAASEESTYRQAAVKMPVPVSQQSRWEAGGEQLLNKEIFLQWNYTFKISCKGDVSSRSKQLTALILQRNKRFRWY